MSLIFENLQNVKENFKTKYKFVTIYVLIGTNYT